MSNGFYPDPNISLAVGGGVILLTGNLTIDDPTYDLVRNKTLYFNGSASITITNTSQAWVEGDTLAIINDGNQIATVTFVSANPVLTQFVTPDLYPGEAVILKIAEGAWTEIARKATPDKFVMESLAAVTTTNEFDSDPVVKFSQVLNLKGGRYKIKLHLENLASNSSRAFTSRLYIDGVPFQGEIRVSRAQAEAVGWATKAGRTGVLTQGNHTFRLDFGKSYGGGNADVTIRNVTLFVESIR